MTHTRRLLAQLKEAEDDDALDEETKGRIQRRVEALEKVVDAEDDEE